MTLCRLAWAVCLLPAVAPLSATARTAVESQARAKARATLRFEVELVSIVPDGPLSGIAGFAGTSGLGPGNLAALVIIALSFIPYFLPEEMRPSFWK